MEKEAQARMEAAVLQAFGATDLEGFPWELTPAQLFEDNRGRYREVFATVDGATGGRLGMTYAPEGFYFRSVRELLAEALKALVGI